MSDFRSFFVNPDNIDKKYFSLDETESHHISSVLRLKINDNIYLIDGEITIGDKKHDKVKDSTLILLSRGEKLNVKTSTYAKFLLISGKPINEEISRGGPFVMNTKAEILQAVQDYHNGTFVK